MVSGNNVREFILRNNGELRKMTQAICFKYGLDRLSTEDMVQDIYLRFLERDVVGGFDPSRGAALTTYLYTIINNQVKDHVRSMAFRISKMRLAPASENADSLEPGDFDDAVRMAGIGLEYRKILDGNMSTDGVDDLSAELREFEQRLTRPALNKKFRLLRRHNKNALRGNCTLLDIYCLLKRDLSSQVIAALYGISTKTVTVLKASVAKALLEFGINPVKVALHRRDAKLDLHGNATRRNPGHPGAKKNQK